MSFRIQDPLFEESVLLHETLLAECEIALEGAGAFAFASGDGVDLLLGDGSFSDFMQRGHFSLIVGLDSITNTAAIERLKAYEDLYGGSLDVKAFVNDAPRSTFHPKMSWFGREGIGTAVVGSGNLTYGGLRGNREAYAVVSLQDEDLAGTRDYWTRWVRANEGRLRSLDDSDVVVMAEENGRHRPWKRTRGMGKRKNVSGASVSLGSAFSSDDFDANLDDDLAASAVTYWLIEHETEILLAEIPAGGARWKQANFDKDNFEYYFGASIGGTSKYRVLLRHVNQDGTLGLIEQRPAVAVKSQNYRFELDAASGLDYPQDGRKPIVLFAKTGTRAFLYQLFMPGDSDYDKASVALDSLGPFPGNRVRRARSRAGAIYPITKELAIWRHSL